MALDTTTMGLDAAGPLEGHRKGPATFTAAISFTATFFSRSEAAGDRKPRTESHPGHCCLLFPPLESSLQRIGRGGCSRPCDYIQTSALRGCPVVGQGQLSGAPHPTPPEDAQKSKEVKSPKSQSKSSLMPSPSSSPK